MASFSQSSSRIDLSVDKISHTGQLFSFKLVDVRDIFLYTHLKFEKEGRRQNKIFKNRKLKRRVVIWQRVLL